MFKTKVSEYNARLHTPQEYLNAIAIAQTGEDLLAIEAAALNQFGDDVDSPAWEISPEVYARGFDLGLPEFTDL